MSDLDELANAAARPTPRYPSPRANGKPLAWTVSLMLVIPIIMAVVWWAPWNPGPVVQPAVAPAQAAPVEAPKDIEASELLEIFRDRPWVAEQHWQYTPIDVTGAVARVEQTSPGVVEVILFDPDDRRGVRCGFLGHNITEARTIRPDTEVVIRGSCIGFMRNGLTLTDCRLLRVTVDTPQKMK